MVSWFGRSCLGVGILKPLVQPVIKGLTIDLDLVTVAEMQSILKRNQGYVDGNKRKLVVWCKK